MCQLYTDSEGRQSDLRELGTPKSTQGYECALNQVNLRKPQVLNTSHKNYVHWLYIPQSQKKIMCRELKGKVQARVQYQLFQLLVISLHREQEH